MNTIITIIGCVIFYFLGRYSTKKPESLTDIKDKITTKIRQIKAREIPTVITYPTREEQDYEESQQKGIDDEFTKNLERAGLE